MVQVISVCDNKTNQGDCYKTIVFKIQGQDMREFEMENNLTTCVNVGPFMIFRIAYLKTGEYRHAIWMVNYLQDLVGGVSEGLVSLISPTLFSAYFTPE